MPWKPSDAIGKTKKAGTPKAAKQWAGTANAVLSKSGDEGKAVRIANAAVNKTKAQNKVFGAQVKPAAKPFGAFGGAKRAARASTKVTQMRRASRLEGKPL